ncbi:MAG: hypothetical protein IKP65_07450 [Alphaproteobacteria bacterium]|nr:hypothetical protein [Alphaproteobacteria bacterium]
MSIEEEIKDYFSKHKLSPTGIRNYFQCHRSEKAWIEQKIKNNSSFNNPGEYIICLVKGIVLPKCKKCGRPVTYKQYMNKRPYCSYKCFKEDGKNVCKNRERTNLKKYGVKNPGELESVKDKRKQTIKQRYGVDYILQNKDYVKKAQNTMMKKYGAYSYLKTEENKKKQYLKSFQTILKWKDHVIPLFSLNEYTGWKHNQEYKWKCVKCGRTFKSRIYMNSAFSRIPRCLHCFPHMTNHSYFEKEILEFIKSIYDGEVISNDRSFIAPYELDIYIPEKKIAIEFDGLFWHNEKSGKDKNYHLNKTELCEKKDVQLIHIFEDEWLEKKDIIKSIIKSKLGIYDKRIYARRCIIKEIDNKTKDAFLESNHLQGKDNSKIKFGLYYENELVSIMTFGKPRFNKHYDYELIRFASKLGYQVIGGCSKLLKHFIKLYTGKSIISYADRRFSNGKVYEAIGFKLINKTKPGYWWEKEKRKYSRYQCQKHKLKKILGNDFKSDLSESENMMFNGFVKIYDCGELVYIKKIK